MIANIFFNSTMDHNNESIYTESYLNFLLTEIMYEKDGCDINFIVNKLEEIYGNVNSSKTNKYLSKHFAEYKGYYLISQEQEKAYIKAKKLKQDLFFLEWESEKEILIKLSNV